MFFLFARVNEALVAHKEITPCKGLATEVAYEWLLLCMGANVALQVFLCDSQSWSRNGIAEGVLRQLCAWRDLRVLRTGVGSADMAATLFCCPATCA